ncbi:Anaerobic C4-dicarboxylate transporter DcuB, partial [Haemophilus influenzae]
MIYTPKVGLN